MSGGALTARRVLYGALGLVAIGVAACSYDYDHFDTLGPRGSGGAAMHDGSSQGGGGADEGGSGGLDAEPDQGSALEGGTDGPGDTGVLADAPADALDAAQDTGPDVGSGDASLDATTEAGDRDSGPDAAPDASNPDALADGSFHDVSADAPTDASLDATPDAAPQDAGPDVDATSCPPGRKACQGGCVAVNDPLFGCGAATCQPCALAHAEAQCTGDRCAVAGCSPRYENCDALDDNGCEAPLDTDVKNCGACHRACSVLNVASLSCTQGACVPTCDLDFASCGATGVGPDDGCETSALANTSCGGCSNDCTKQGASGGFACNSGMGTRHTDQCGCTGDTSCRVGASQGTCNGSTGRCNCGNDGCVPGEACLESGGNDTCSCNGGAACAATQTCCQTPAGCRSLDTDPANCGGCGHACPVGFSCEQGACACTADSQCNAGRTGTCQGGVCKCTGRSCGRGERCQADGSCG